MIGSPKGSTPLISGRQGRCWKSWRDNVVGTTPCCYTWPKTVTRTHGGNWHARGRCGEGKRRDAEQGGAAYLYHRGLRRWQVDAGEGVVAPVAAPIASTR